MTAEVEVETLPSPEPFGDEYVYVVKPIAAKQSALVEKRKSPQTAATIVERLSTAFILKFSILERSFRNENAQIRSVAEKHKCCLMLLQASRQWLRQPVKNVRFHPEDKPGQKTPAEQRRLR